MNLTLPPNSFASTYIQIFHRLLSKDVIAAFPQSQLDLLIGHLEMLKRPDAIDPGKHLTECEKFERFIELEIIDTILAMVLARRASAKLDKFK